MNSEKGLVILYTGEGKGKTTAALGLVLRAVGYKKKCLIIQFGKTWFTGELVGIKKLSPLVKIIQGGKGFLDILGSKIPMSIHKKAAGEAYELLYKEALSDKWDVVVADEIVGSVAAGVLSLSKVLKLIKDKPSRLDLVLTGHHAKKKLMDKADLVTEMKEVKHPFQKGILAKKAIDF
ncbi:cob(I)yrinic acid a,c-diamide adenosyltransferase [Candidatus Daviesbacteria bacterium RIFCSPLOWO2_02_FULL_36_8]|uniref:Cob(I)yrinic acid a,c-diamide adenosyltransferase n=1 Tax=Candidatus Daviesbacteria bacterium RIFCSPLOWO2_02_FULL_36_8 TaxID=1797793 RepID=A0A1F5MFE9_9BACT|nr:MAG: cob(I)yrinic acid a,c-diamide adenosyltransferase [Candidatus Daviesbacteria bacterium RIFCSPLOWO2_02_FULL_36_8]